MMSALHEGYNWSDTHIHIIPYPWRDHPEGLQQATHGYYITPPRVWPGTTTNPSIDECDQTIDEPY